MKKIIFTLCLLLSLSTINAQSKGAWGHIPGFDPALHTTLTNQSTLVGVIGLAALSYGLEEFVFKNHENINFYTARIGMNNEYAWGLKNVWHENIGAELRVASWFSVSGEINIQEWHDQTPYIENKDIFGMGMGLMSYYRWYLFGKKRISPYIEYGTGLFFGFEKFPYNGTNFTFNNSTQLGIEYTLKNGNKIRASYGNFNQTNYNYLDSNPAYNGNGFSASYSCRIK